MKLIRRTVFVGLSLLSFGVAFYALAAYLGRPPGAAVHPDMRAVYHSHPVGIYTHVFAAAVALILGPLQFVPFLRRNHPAFHRAAGKTYLGVGVGVGGVAGLYMSWFAYGGAVSTAGFGLLALAWLYSGVRAYRSARAGDFVAHRRWAVRSFSLALAAVSLRLLLVLGSVAGIPFDVLYPSLSWVSWVPNLILAEICLQAGRRSLTRVIEQLASPAPD